MRSREDRSAFVPNYLLVMEESNPQQPREHFAGEFGSMPDVADLQAWHEREGL